MRPLRRRTAVSALLLALATGAGAGSTVVATGGGGRPHADRTLLDEVRDRGELRVCTTGDYRPFTHLDPDSGEYSGIDVDMAADLAASLDVEAEFVPTTWAELLPDLTSGACDISMGGVSVTLARAREAYFSVPYLVDGKAPIARCADQDRYRTLEDIDQPGVRVIVNPGGTNERFVDEHIERATVVRHPENTTIFEEIVAGRADVMITDTSETRYQETLHPELCAINPDEPFTFAEKAYLLPRGDEEFRAYVDQWLHLALNDGTYAGYAAEWEND
ncbi:transporter substrate-binding domain-containing protein [Streptomyces hainanensis]|uniref:Transporter substrate-binding domain-containing protein n=1 Tax=Streptomyces hainanensis TaxID=402648 RepID=A0A4R4TQ67_9ACTN|nr:transporter substrate-binding domain-containing protein [Streptomyces hainanensis]TDC80337.1 transporter substrate-binding domain-containing protein [Streptomyces hainanensis]